jgi:hypothetical protein
MYVKKYRLVAGLFLLLIVLFLSGCITPTDNPELPPRGFFMGILPIPGDNQDIPDAYAQAAEFADYVPVWGSGIGATGFWEMPAKLRGTTGKLIVNQYIRGNGMFPLLHFSFMTSDDQGSLILHTPPSLPDATLSDPAWRALYVESVVDAVKIVKPLYLSTGNEVNRWYEQYGTDEDNPNGFQHFISLHEEIYRAVKDVSPDTLVFCVFAREIVSEYREADLEVLELFDPETLDLLVFTSYPYAVSSINHPSDIPSDYYTQIFQHISKKTFGFSELGWPALEFFGGEQGQAEFLRNVSSSLTKDQGIDLSLFGYCWLHDVSDQDTTGLIMRDGTERLAYMTWQEISTSGTM